MKTIGRIFNIFLCLAMITALTVSSYADDTRVVTLGANLSPSQRQQMLDYFGVKENDVHIITVNNQQERKYLGGIATESQLAKVTMSCSYVEPTAGDEGINVKTANLTWVTGSMIASTLTTAGITSANVVAAAPFPVSGTGALTGIMIAFENASGKKLDETKKKLASQELMVTGNLGDKVGQDKATGIVNDVKEKVIKDDIKNPEDLKAAISDTGKKYNVDLTSEQIDKLIKLMKEIGAQHYNYNDIKNTLNNITNNINVSLHNNGSVSATGFFDKVKAFFSGSGSSGNFGIINKTDDSKLNADAVISATSQGIKNASEVVNQQLDNAKKSGFFDRILSFFSNLFNS